MNSVSKGLILSGLMLLASAQVADAALTKTFYKNSSVLSTGNWVKVGVEKTGVYEISYDELRAMGFSNPSKVAVYGRGGTVLSESFVTSAGVPILTDDLAPVKIFHDTDRIYFYGIGPEEIAFETNSSYDIGGCFRRKSNNIYTRRGYYFLTDSQTVTQMSEKNYDSAQAQNITSGYSYIYHELDSVQNDTKSGQLFWGEAVGHPGMMRRNWDVNLPDAIGGNGIMECNLYIFRGDGSDEMRDQGFGSNATVSWGFEDTENFVHTPYNRNTTLYYAPHQPTIANVDVPGENGQIFIEFIGEDMGNFSNLDFWVVTYERNLPTLQNESQQLVVFPQIAKNTTGRLEFTDADSFVVFDVSNPSDPQRLKTTRQGNKMVVGVRNTSKFPVLAIFDKSKTQLQISGYEKAYSSIANQNLHSLRDEGADFVIITVPSFKACAEEIAELHRRHDGIKVVVATTEECYNEFSQGVPDPMAYRSFMKMLYFSDRKPKNLLLIGPLLGDFRGLQTEHNPLEGIIAYQSPSISTSRGAHNINDFYGMMDDKFRVDYYERNGVQIGVGILPIQFDTEAKIVVDKIRNYLERDDHAYYLNRYTALGGLGDAHTHEIQVRDINTHIRNVDFNGATLFTPLPLDSYGNSEAQKKFINQLNDGCGIFSYFGHGAEQFIGKDRYFFTAGDVFKLRNKILPLALFGGCQITNSDRGFRGLGETLVTATPYGAIGSIVSARATWSGQNYEFFKQFFTCLFKSGSSVSTTHNYTPVTIGEVYARVKHYSTYNNELAYQLLCDPALVIPTINRRITASKYNTEEAIQLVPGEKLTLQGIVEDADGNQDTAFNGKVVLRICEPDKKIAAGAIETKEDPKGLEFTYRDSQITMSVADVENGYFLIDMYMPEWTSSLSGQSANLYFSAYDPSTKTGAGRCHNITIGSAHANSSESLDKVAPIVENLAFNEEDCTIALAVSDNRALNLSNSPLNKGLYLYIDGKERSEAHFAEPMMETDRPAYSKNVFIDGLSYGEHSARIKVKDAAGNYAESEIVFTYEPAKAKYALVRSEESSPETTVIGFADGLVPAAATLVVLSPGGTEIWRGNIEGETFEWNHVDFSGNTVAPGHYKAYIIETGQSSTKGHSETIDIPVI